MVRFPLLQALRVAAVPPAALPERPRLRGGQVPSVTWRWHFLSCRSRPESQWPLSGLTRAAWVAVTAWSSLEGAAGSLGALCQTAAGSPVGRPEPRGDGCALERRCGAHARVTRQHSLPRPGALVTPILLAVVIVQSNIELLVLKLLTASLYEEHKDV